MNYITVSVKRSYRQASLVMPEFRALQAVWHPEKLIEREFQGFTDKPFKPARAVFLGKCAVSMAAGFSRNYAEIPKLVYSTLPERETRHVKNAKFLWGSHPDQSRLNIENSKALVEWLASTRGDLAAFVSGGASALLSSPPPPWTLKEVASIEGSLLSAGAPIGKINKVRMVLSGLKAGGMIKLAGNCAIRSYVWCDVPPGLFKMTGSAPFWNPGGISKPAPSDILKEFGIIPPRPLPRKAPLKKPARSSVFKLADGEMMVGDFVRMLRDKRIDARRIRIIEGTSAMEASKEIAVIAKSAARPCVLVGNGEYPVEVKGKGAGGRCSHLTALIAKELYGTKRWFFAAAATDGEDGGSGGGAYVSDEALPGIKELNDAIRKCDTGALFEKNGTLIPRQPTGNNLRDLWLLSLEEER